MPVELWKAYKLEHNKNYEDAAEETRRFEIFKANLKTITEHNEKFDKGEVTWKMGLNHMSDWTPEEKNRLCGLRPPN